MSNTTAWIALESGLNLHVTEDYQTLVDKWGTFDRYEVCTNDGQTITIAAKYIVAIAKQRKEAN